jgi:hypothetical protein
MRIVPLAVLGYLPIVVAGCTSFAPDPTSPECHFSVRVKSVPTAADVYGVSIVDGKLTEKIGTTPCTISVGVARQYYEDGTPTYQNYWRWSPADCVLWSRRTGRDLFVDEWQWNLLLNIAVVKEGYDKGLVKNRIIGSVGYRYAYPPIDRSITVPLEPSERGQPPAPPSAATVGPCHPSF